MDSGHTERIGLDRSLIVALPYGGTKGGRLRPFPDDVARALASDANLERLETFDFEDRGLRDIWAALVLPLESPQKPPVADQAAVQAQRPGRSGSLC